jgi:hypothetical protein
MKTKMCLILAALALVVGGCERTYESALKTEKARVVQLAYVPASRGTGSGSGMSSSGNFVVTSTTVNIPEVYAVVFKCEDHGHVFSLTGKDIYSHAIVGEEVTLEYVEVIKENSKKEQTVVDYRTKRVLFNK